MEIKVHGIPMCTSTALVLLCLSEKVLEYELLPVEMSKGAHKQQPCLSLNPFGQMHAFEDGDISKQLYPAQFVLYKLLHHCQSHEQSATTWHLNTTTQELTCSCLVAFRSPLLDLWIEVEAHLCE
ncbi:hypothetical protein NC652_024712 [Populus alba x Populus x berolinensis]|nr:hypothetical protein NC652_024712 [Populus alba x Populus x berolinensis]